MPQQPLAQSRDQGRCAGASLYEGLVFSPYPRPVFAFRQETPFPYGARVIGHSAGKPRSGRTTALLVPTGRTFPPRQELPASAPEPSSRSDLWYWIGVPSRRKRPKLENQSLKGDVRGTRLGRDRRALDATPKLPTSIDPIRGSAVFGRCLPSEHELRDASLAGFRASSSCELERLINIWQCGPAVGGCGSQPSAAFPLFLLQAAVLAVPSPQRQPNGGRMPSRISEGRVFVP